MFSLHRPASGEIGFAPGAYDLLHTGHLNLLRTAMSRCDHLVAAVASDRLVRVRKRRNPVLPDLDRAAIVDALNCVDSTIIDDEADRTVTWRRLGVTVVFKGSDWRDTPGGAALEKAAHSVGARVEYLPHTDGVSSTLLRAALHGVYETRSCLEWETGA